MLDLGDERMDGGQAPLSLSSSPTAGLLYLRCMAMVVLTTRHLPPGAHLVTDPRHRLAPVSVRMTLDLASDCILIPTTTDAELEP